MLIVNSSSELSAIKICLLKKEEILKNQIKILKNLILKASDDKQKSVYYNQINVFQKEISTIKGNIYYPKDFDNANAGINQSSIGFIDILKLPFHVNQFPNYS